MTFMKPGTEVCPVGSKTDRPCRRHAVVELPGSLPDGDRLCTVHAALQPLIDYLDELDGSLELLEEFEDRARENNCRPFLRHLERAKAEFTERLEALETNVEAVYKAR